MAGPETSKIDGLPFPVWGFGPPSPEPDTKKLDALLASLNASAERFQTLWFSFLGLSLYLAITALATTHRDLLLNNPQTLPILNIKVELLPFYVIAPLLYLVFHFYLLMMLALLARTAAEFDKQLRTTLRGEPERERYRAQVGNALFAQLLVGMKGERTGVNALLMGLIALITIVLAPLATLVLMQMMFLPYHHLRITWWHRAVVVADLVLIVVMTYRCFFPRGVRKAPQVLGALSRKRRWAASMVFCVLLAIALAPLAYWLSFQQGRWAGEPTPSSFKEWALWMAGDQPPFPQVFPDHTPTANGVVFGLFPDRLKLASETIVGKEKWEKAKEEIASRKGAKEAPKETPYENDFVPTISLDGRDLQAADLLGADLRGVSLYSAALWGANLALARLDGGLLIGAQLQGADLKGAQLLGADLQSAELQGADLGSAGLQGADLSVARLQGAYLREAQLQGADLHFARLQGADLMGAQLQGANLREARLQAADLAGAELQGADLREAQLQGAILSNSQLQGASLFVAHLQGVELSFSQLEGADLFRAQLQGADLMGAQLQGANLHSAELQGANLGSAGLQGADLEFAQFQGADLSHANLADSAFAQTFVFRTNIADANLATSSLGFVDVDLVSPQDVDGWIAAATEFAPAKSKDDIVKRFDRLKLDFQTPDQDAANFVKWKGLEESYRSSDPDAAQHRQRLAKFLGDLACETANSPHIARRLVRQGFITGLRLAALGDQLVAFRTRLEEGRKEPEKCPGVTGFTEDDWRRLDAIKPAVETAPADR